MTLVRDRLARHLEVLVEDVGARPPGSPANRRATSYVAGVLGDCGLSVVEHPFATRWWEPGDGSLATSQGVLGVRPDPYAATCDVRGRLERVERLDELEELAPDPARILVLDGELASEQILPAAFPFLDVPHHARTRAALRRLRPAGVIALSDDWQPVLEDPDLGLSSTTLPTVHRDALTRVGWAHLRLGGAVHDGRGSTVAARHGPAADRAVVSAHLDSKATTPGAFDNAAGVAVLLALAETWDEDPGPVELVLFNGEDHFDACGEVAWLHATELAEVHAAINVDGVGLSGRGTSLATLACPSGLEQAVADWLAGRAGWVRAEPWLESDHALFAMRGIPALAITSEDVHQLLGGLAHTPADTLDVLDLDVLTEVVLALPSLLALVRTSGPH